MVEQKFRKLNMIEESNFPLELKTFSHLLKQKKKTSTKPNVKNTVFFPHL